MEKNKNSSSVRLSNIDVYKGVCIIFVIITHFSWSDEERLHYLFPFWIGMAIPIFMILSGYVNALSFKRHRIYSVEKAYDFKSVCAKCIRFTVPFLIVFLIDGIVSSDFHTLKKDGPLGVLCSFARGGYGAGSYYFPFLIQFIFVFPIIYFIIDKYDLKGYLYCGIINLIYEFLVRAYGVNLKTYRILVLRYIWVIAFGVFLAIGKKKISKIAYAVMMAVGSVYIVLFLYIGEKPFITKWWIGTNMWASLFIIPIVALIISVNISFPPMELIGKSSYHIFLVQMIYYNHKSFFYKYLPKRYEKLLFNVIICTCLGILFYLVESPISKTIRNRIFDCKKGE